MAYPVPAELVRPPTVLGEGSAVMIDHGPLTEPEAPAVREEETGPAPAAPPSLQALEERVRRLEDAVAALQEPRHVVAARTEIAAAVSDGGAPTLRERSATIADAGRRLLPLAMSLLRPLDPPADGPTPAQPWLPVETYDDIRCICRMYFDRRYRVRWSALLVPVCLLGVMLFSWMFLSGLWVVGPLLDKAVDLVLAFLAYKVLVREAQRYRAAVAYLPEPMHR